MAVLKSGKSNDKYKGGQSVTKTHFFTDSLHNKEELRQNTSFWIWAIAAVLQLLARYWKYVILLSGVTYIFSDSTS